MSETESSSKKERMVCDSGCDMLSKLPSSIMEIILSSVSTRDAVRTSILSRQFRYKWISLPHLVLDISEFSSVKCMEKFVTSVLKLHKGPVHKFEMLLQEINDSQILDDWLLILPRDEIRELTLKLGSDNCYYYCENSHQVRSIAYSCNKLARLELQSCELGSPPLTFTGFLFLRCLILIDVNSFLSTVESIVANSPLLETLKMYGVGGFDECPELRISAPNLKYLDFQTYLNGCMQVYICAPLLAEMSASIKLNDYCQVLYQRETSSTYNYTNFFGGCNRLRKLEGNFFNKVMSYGINSCQYSFVLPHLEVIELDDVNFEDVKEVSFVVHLVTGAPNLEKLELWCFYGAEDLSASDVSCMDILHAPNIKWEKLRIITMKYFTGLPAKIGFLKLVLEHSPTLERVNLYTSGLNFQETEDLKAEVFKCKIASSNLKLWLG